jgi:hypothetical protein
VEAGPAGSASYYRAPWLPSRLRRNQCAGRGAARSTCR